MAVNQADLKYPKSVFFIISNEFCERFSYYGMRTALSLYFVDILMYSENTATVLFHAFTMLAYFFPLIGAIIADSWLGKFRTILYLSIVYAFGQLLLAASASPPLNLPVREFSLLGLLLIALGTGGIKPCVSSFGGDQFKLPEQEAHLSTFFSYFYQAINAGSLISMFITPTLRKGVTCFGQNSCYSLAFLVPSILMVLSTVIFIAGKKMYRIKEPEGNVFFDVSKCVAHAVSRKYKSKEKRKHWLDYADDKYDTKMIADIKSCLNILKLFIPLPFFWALFDQQGSRWTFQATRMDGEFFGYLIKPDQFQVINPVFIVAFIPVFQWVIYPFFGKLLHINTPLRKLTIGGFLAAVSFIISGILELKLEQTYAIQPSSGLAQVRIFNTINCNASLTIDNQEFVLESLGMYQNLSVPITDFKTLSFEAKFTDCPSVNSNSPFVGSLNLEEAKATSWALTRSGLSAALPDTVEKSQTGDPKIRALVYVEADVNKATLRLSGDKGTYNLEASSNLGFSEFLEVTHSKYDVSFDGKSLQNDVEVRYGGVYTIVGYVSKDESFTRVVEVAPANTVHIFWLLPQYIVISMSEIMFSITGLEFAFTQAPSSMKSILSACWLLTVACGNLIVVIIAEAHLFDRQALEFFLFAGLMIVDMIIFSVMAMYYKYNVNISPNSSMDDGMDLNEKHINNETYSKDL